MMIRFEWINKCQKTSLLCNISDQKIKNGIRYNAQNRTHICIRVQYGFGFFRPGSSGRNNDEDNHQTDKSYSFKHAYEHTCMNVISKQSCIMMSSALHKRSPLSLLKTASWFNRAKQPTTTYKTVFPCLIFFGGTKKKRGKFPCISRPFKRINPSVGHPKHWDGDGNEMNTTMETEQEIYG